MKTLLLAVGFSLFLSACGAESDAKKAVLASLKDPDSAKFGKFTQVENSACLTVNARNSMGGYTGDQQATLMQVDKEWEVSSINETSHDTCVSVIKSVLKQQHVLEQQEKERLKKLDKEMVAEHKAQIKKCSEIKDCTSCPMITLRNCPDCFDMVVIPAGGFEMGISGARAADHIAWNNKRNAEIRSDLSLTADDPSFKDISEKDLKHSVSLKSFALGKTEVTQGQWRAVMGSNPSSFRNCGDNIDDNLPVEQVSWDDVKGFIEKLNSKTGKQYRLPTEAEWEYACRAGVGQEYCGSDNLDSVAWHADNRGHSTSPVGRKQANAWGLYDMSGNVWEWVEDSYRSDSDSHVGASSDGSALEVYGKNNRVVRGGSWDNHAKDIREPSRTYYEQDRRYGYIGFRLARTLP